MDIIKECGIPGRQSQFRVNAVQTHKRRIWGNCVHYNAISDVDLEKIYSSMATSTEGPVGLYNKLQFDIRRYFFHHGAENIHNMTKSHFIIAQDENDGEYVVAAMDERKTIEAVPTSVHRVERCPPCQVTLLVQLLRSGNMCRSYTHAS